MRLKFQDAVDVLTVLGDNVFKEDTNTLYQDNGKDTLLARPVDSGCNNTNLL